MVVQIHQAHPQQPIQSDMLRWQPPPLGMFAQFLATESQGRVRLEEIGVDPPFVHVKEVVGRGLDRLTTFDGKTDLKYPLALAVPGGADLAAGKFRGRSNDLLEHGIPAGGGQHLVRYPEQGLQPREIALLCRLGPLPFRDILETHGEVARCGAVSRNRVPPAEG